MNKTILKVLTGTISVALAICAAFFSIVGLSKLFAGAAIAVIFMASILEASKLVIASFLYQYWKTLRNAFKIYLLGAVIIIAIITSIGIYGFLSNAYLETKSKYELSLSATDSLNSEKMLFDVTINSIQTQLVAKNTQLNNLLNIRNTQEQRANQLVSFNKSTSTTEKNVRQTDISINNLNNEVSVLNEKLIKYTDSSAKIQVLILQTNLQNSASSELGPLTYIASIFNTDMDRVVNILILLFIFVFDPLAICLTIAFNYLNSSTIHKEGNDIVNTISEFNSETGRIPSIATQQDFDIPKESQTDILSNMTNDHVEYKNKSTYSGGVKF